MSCDEPVDQLKFWRMVQAAADGNAAADAAAAAAAAADGFKIEFGRSLMGRLSGVLHSLGVGLGAHVHGDVVAEGDFSSSLHYERWGVTFDV